MNGPSSLRSMHSRLRRRPRGTPIAAVILLGLACGAVGIAGAAPPCTPCALIIADNAMYDRSTTPSHGQLLKQKNPSSSTALDGLQLKGWVPSTNFQAWTPSSAGAAVCFSDQNPAGTFTGTTETLTGQAFDGSKGWTSNGSGTSHKYLDVSSPPKIVKAKVTQYSSGDWKFLVKIKNADGSYGSETPSADRPASATLYFGTAGADGCAHTTFGASDCEDNASSTNETCVR